MKPLPVRFACWLAIQAACLPSLLAQGGGDQFLDGIGETALVARYDFAGHEKDSSRNMFHASVQGSGSSYVEDAKFGRVLALPGGNGAFVRIPGRAFDGLDTLSVSGWIMLRSPSPAPLFDFGQNSALDFFCIPGDNTGATPFVAGITKNGRADVQGLVAPAIPTNRWTHVAVVVDAAQKTLKYFVDGRRTGENTNVSLTLETILNQDDGDANQAFIGRSQDVSAPRLNALVHDFRIYSVALTDPQVAVIHRNALSPADARSSTENAGQSAADAKSGGIAQPMASWLTHVADVTVETQQGVQPELPCWIPGQYRNGIKGPAVRVIWPSPIDNHLTLTTGTFTVTGRVPGTKLLAKATVVVKGSSDKLTPARRLEAFPLGSVTLNRDEKQRDTQFIKNRDKFIRGLAASNPDRFLYMFRDAFGQPQPVGAEPLDGWDNQTTRLRGHASGHYLSAIAQACASTTYDEALHANFEKKMNDMIDTLWDLSRKSGVPAKEGGPSNADPTTVPPGPGKTTYDSDLSRQGIRTDYWNWGRGFISAYPPDQFIMLERGAVYGGQNNQIWAPYYTLHKILAGLLDCYEAGGNKKALEIAEGMGRWVHARLQKVPTGTRIKMWNRYIAGEYGGMNEVLARLSRITGDTNFMECARLFDNIDFFFGNAAHEHGLARNVDTLRGRHANQHIPQIIGALETYRNIHESDYWRIPENFWTICTHSYMYGIGGVAGARNPNNAECFTAQPDSLFANGFSKVGQNETCATYNLLKLSRQLFMFQQDARYMDYYEQALYNHILASVADRDAGNTYHVPLNPGTRKQFGNAAMDGFTCCNGTALESNTKLHDSIYFRSADNRTLYVNLYVPSRLNWSDRKVTVTQKTDFPCDDTTRLVIGGGGGFEIKVRVPGWATRGFIVSINGQNQNVKAEPGSYLALGQSWKDGDVIELKMPFGFRLSPLMDQPNIACLFYGPVLLAAEENATRATWRPITLDESDPGKSITGDPCTLRFESGDARFKPFYETYGRCSVYLDVTLK
jgi:DUF1680 family protein